MPALSGLPIDSLNTVPIGTLRSDAVRTHAVCRRRTCLGEPTALSIAVHPVAILEPSWHRYASFLLYHEYLHALGFWRHDRNFRDLERLWDSVDDDARVAGNCFTRYLVRRKYRWVWLCPECGREHLRQRRQNGRYSCTNLEAHGRGVLLVDTPNSLYADAAANRVCTSTHGS